VELNALLTYVCGGRGWPMVPAGTDFKIEVPTEPGRSQVVQITPGLDPEGRVMVWIWSQVCELTAVADPWFLLRKNAELAYGALAVRGQQVMLIETRRLQSADADDFASAIHHVARMADALEKLAYGQHVDQR
jgi:hypothetical protein